MVSIARALEDASAWLREHGEPGPVSAGVRRGVHAARAARALLLGEGTRTRLPWVHVQKQPGH